MMTIVPTLFSLHFGKVQAVFVKGSVASDCGVCVEPLVYVESHEEVVFVASDTSGVVAKAVNEVKTMKVVSCCSTVTANLVPMLLRRTS